MEMWAGNVFLFAVSLSGLCHRENSPFVSPFCYNKLCAMPILQLSMDRDRCTKEFVNLYSYVVPDKSEVAVTSSTDRSSKFSICLLSCLFRNDPPVVSTQNSGLHPNLRLYPCSRHRGSRAEDAGEEVKGHRGAAADGEGLHQRPADVCRGDH